MSTNRNSWKNHPLTQPKLIELDMHFTVQLDRVRPGFLPETMEDKWFVFYEDGWLYMHRSWTGNGMYKAEVVEEGNGYVVREIWTERNPELYTNVDDETDIRIFKSIVEMMVRQNKSA